MSISCQCSEAATRRDANIVYLKSDFCLRGYSSVVRALPLHGKGRRFETGYSYKINCVNPSFGCAAALDSHWILFCYSPQSSFTRSSDALGQCPLALPALPPILHSQVGKAANVLNAVPLRIDAQLPRPEDDDLVFPFRCCCLELPWWHRLEPDLQMAGILRPFKRLGKVLSRPHGELAREPRCVMLLSDRHGWHTASES